MEPPHGKSLTLLHATHVLRHFVGAFSSDSVPEIGLQKVLVQCALNIRSSSPVQKSVAAALARDPRADASILTSPGLMHHTNKPVLESPLESVLQLPRGTWVWAAASNFSFNAVAAQPPLLAVGGSDSLVRVLHQHSRDELFTLAGAGAHTGEISHTLFTNSRTLVSVAPCKPYRKNNDLCVWDCGTGRLLQKLELRGHCYHLATSRLRLAARTSSHLSIYDIDAESQKIVESDFCELEAGGG